MQDQKLQQVSIWIDCLAQQVNLFKIFGSQSFSFDKAYTPSQVDWSGFYTQYTPQHSMRYLTKKWDDGADYACLILMKPIKPVRIIKIETGIEVLSDPKISGQKKAQLIKSAIIKKCEKDIHFKGYYIEKHDKLMEFLGKRGTLMECVDMEDNQVIIPHDMLNGEYFQYIHLLGFKKSKDGMLRTINWCNLQQGLQQPIWQPVKGQSQYEPYLLLKESPQISEILSKHINSNKQ